AWCRIGLGRSLLTESDDGLVMDGVVQLMHLPARFGDEQPYLTGVALAESAAALSRLGDTSGSASVEALLQQSYAGHPALEWTEMMRRRPRGTSPAPASAPSQGSVPEASARPSQGSSPSESGGERR